MSEESMKLVDKWLFSIDHGDITNGEAKELAALITAELSKRDEEIKVLRKGLEKIKKSSCCLVCGCLPCQAQDALIEADRILKGEL